MKSKLRNVRLIHLAFIAVIPIYGSVAEIVHHPGGNNWTWRQWVVTVLVLWAAEAGFRVRRLMLNRSEQTLAKNPSDPKALKQWEAGHMVGLAMAESIVLWGIVLRTVLGGAFWQASLFYAGGLILLLIWTPRLPAKLASN